MVELVGFQRYYWIFKKVLVETKIFLIHQKKAEDRAKSFKIPNKDFGQKSQSFFTHFKSLKGFFGEVKSKTLKKK